MRLLLPHSDLSQRPATISRSTNRSKADIRSGPIINNDSGVSAPEKLLDPMKTHAPLLFLASLLSACSGINEEISAQLQAQFDASSTAPINLDLVGPSSWERVCVLKPYISNEQAEKVLGFKWNATGKTSIGGNDGINVLVFVKGSEVIAYTEYRRNKGDFLHLYPLCLQRDRAIVVRQIDPDPRNKGWVNLVASETGNPPGISAQLRHDAGEAR
jgi:hypothetical protein